MKHSLLFIVSFVACTAVQAVAVSVVSASDLDSLTHQFNLNEVEVTARRREEPVIPVQTLSGARLEGLSTQSVADAARYFSGVQIKDYGGVGGMKTIDVRSMGTNHLGVFYDGIEIGNAQNGTVDLGKFSMDNIEELALYNGLRQCRYTIHQDPPPEVHTGQELQPEHHNESRHVRTG